LTVALESSHLVFCTGITLNRFYTAARMKTFSIMIVLALSLMSCAPVSFQPGASGFSPFQAKAGKVSLPAPGVWFIKAPADIRVEREAGDAVFDGFYGYNDVSAGFKKTSPVTWVALDGIEPPKGWKVELVRQEGTREVTSVRIEGDTKYYYFRDSMDVVLSVTVPNGTKPGFYPVTAFLKTMQDGNKGSVEVMVELTPPIKSAP
jgi:hypothetical protein